MTALLILYRKQECEDKLFAHLCLVEKVEFDEFNKLGERTYIALIPSPPRIDREANRLRLQAFAVQEWQRPPHRNGEQRKLVIEWDDTGVLWEI